MRPEQETPEEKPDVPAKPPTLDNPAEDLDFGNMDLSIEKVEERISPSETNVFDK